MITVISSSRRETAAIGGVVAGWLNPGDTVVLTGELGGGKTALVSGAVSALGCADAVSSPTFAIVQEYEGPVPIAHADLYRLGSVQELFDFGFEELFDGTRVVFVEWGDRALDVLPASYLHISMQHRANPDERLVELIAHGTDWIDRLVAIEVALDASLGIQRLKASQ